MGDCNALDLAPESIDFIVSSNTLEHLRDPTMFLTCAEDLLVDGGQLLVVVPPVLSDADLVAHARNRHHVSLLSVRGWAELFASRGWAMRFFSQRATAALDFASPLPSVAGASDFVFVEEPVSGAYSQAPLAATYLLWRAA